jgi:hypothetical protein
MSAATQVAGCYMEKTPEDQQVAAWLAAQTETDGRQIEAELEEGERRRAFVADELIEAGFTGSELVELAMRLTGLTSAGVQALIVARAEIAASRSSDPELSKRDRSLAENEILFRAVNERLAAAAGGSSLPRQLDLVCECSDRACLKVFTMPAAEYEWLRQNPLRFVVLPGHEAPAVEDVVGRHEGFVIVEKHAESHRQVEASDPRA